MPKKSPHDIAETHERFIDAGCRLAMERGYRGFTVRDLCERAGLSIGALYDHFDGKRDFIHSCIRNHGGQTHTAARYALIVDDPALTRLRDLVRGHLESWGGRWGKEDASLTVSTLAEYLTDPEAAEPYIGELAGVLVEVGRTVREGQRTGEIERHVYAPAVAKAVTAMLLGLAVLQRLGWKFTPLRMGQAVDVLLRGLAPSSPPAPVQRVPQSRPQLRP